MTNEEFNRLSPEAQATIRSGLLLQQMLANADSARVVLPLVDAAVKKANPSHMTVEEQAAPIVAKMREEFQAELSKRDKAAAEASAIAGLTAQIAAAKANDGFTDEGIANVLKQMEEKRIGDFDAAKKAYLYDHPAPSATPAMSTQQMYWNTYEGMNSGSEKAMFFPEGGIPSITQNPDVWERETALRYLNGDIALPTG